MRLKMLTENNNGKYLIFAIGEIVLIMVGILLAVQVSEWNQGRKDRIEEKLILTRLNDEMTENLEKISWLLQGFQRKEKAMDKVSLVFSGKPVETDSLFLSDVIISASWGWTVQSLQRLIYEELNNTGRLAIIRNIELRNSITELYNYVQVYEGTGLSRTNDYSRILYAIIPEERSTRLKKGLSPSEQKAIVDAVMNSNLNQRIIFEQNRARYLIRMWNILEESIAQVKAEIESEMNR